MRYQLSAAAKYKRVAAAFFHAAALACLAAGCSRAPQSAGFVGAQTTPAPAATASAQATAERKGLCPEGVPNPLPPPTGYVNDYANVIDDATQRRLEEKLVRLKERANIEQVVVTVETTGGQDIARYSLDLARCWGIGPPAGEDGGGVLLLVAVKDRWWRIQNTRSLDADLGDMEVAKLGDRMKQHFASGAFGAGVEAGIDAIIARLAEKRNFQP